MRKVSIILVLIMLSIVGSNVYGDLLIVTIKESELPFDLSPSNYDNSPSNYDNSVSNYDNSPSNYDTILVRNQFAHMCCIFSAIFYIFVGP